MGPLAVLVHATKCVTANIAHMTADISLVQGHCSAALPARRLLYVLAQLVADGLLVHTDGLTISEAALTGEADPIKKTLDVDPWCRSGTQVCCGLTPGFMALCQPSIRVSQPTVWLG